MIITLTFSVSYVHAQESIYSNYDSLLLKNINVLKEQTRNRVYNENKYVNGLIYQGSGSIENHPYFIDNAWKLGIIECNSEIYFVDKMKYDLVQDAVVIINPIDGSYPVKLKSDYIHKFTLNGNVFVDTVVFKRTGYFQQAYKNNVSVLIKRKKQKGYEQYTKKTIYNTNVEIFVINNNQAYRIKNLRTLYNVFHDKKSELKSYVAQNKLIFKEDKIKNTVELTRQYEKFKN